MRTRRTISVISLLLLLMSVLLGIWSCQNPGGEPYPNAPPETRLANVPANDTIALYILQGAIPEQTLYWAGDDADGFIVGYKYGWTDFHDIGPEVTEQTTILNLTNISGSPLDTLIQVAPSVASVARVYNFFSTLNPQDPLIGQLDDSLATGHYFPVPYKTGIIAGDSVKGVNPIEIEAPNKGIFIFNSPADSNLHRFSVSSIDNSDAVDPTPATVNFWTLPSPNLTVQFLTGPVASSPASLVLRCATEVNPGLRFTFRGIDPSTNERQFSWSVDDTLHWSPWSDDAFAVVTSANFQETGSDTHTIFLRGRNRWGVISPIIFQRFRAVVPAIDDPLWPHRTLLIVNTRNVPVGSPPRGGTDTTLVKNFYLEVLDSLGKRDSVDVWTVSSANAFAFPTREILGRYTCVLIAAEERVQPLAGGQWQIGGDKIARLREYLFSGGKLIFSGTSFINGMIGGYDNWANEIFHIVPTNIIPQQRNDNLDLARSIGRLGYPDIHIDSTKVPADSMHAIRAISLAYPRGFGETISLFDSKTDNPVYENQPLGIRYLGPILEPGCRQIYSVVHFGFPLYFGKKADVTLALKKAFADINENSIP